MDVKHARRLLTHLPSDSREIRIGSARTVVTLGMRRVISQRDDWLGVMIKRDELQDRVNCPDWRFSIALLLSAGRKSHPSYLAVLAQNSPIRRHLDHFGAAESDVGDRPCPGNGLCGGDCSIVDHLSGVGHVEQPPRQTVLGQDCLDTKIQAGSVMLVQRVDGYPLGRRPDGLRQFRSENLVSPVSDPDPIHGAQHDRSVVIQEHDAPAGQRHHDLLERIVGQRTTQGRRRIHLESRHTQRFRGSQHAGKQ